MNALSSLVRFHLTHRPAPLCYHEGETNRCPQCGNKGWIVGRLSAECSHCGHPLPLAQAVISGAPAEQIDSQ
jgi:uncharacterized protein (DUF983 family)